MVRDIVEKRLGFLPGDALYGWAERIARDKKERIEYRECRKLDEEYFAVLIAEAIEFLIFSWRG